MDYPRIDSSALPAEEQEAASFIEMNLYKLHSSAAEYRYIFELYVHAHERKLAGQDDTRRMISWMRIAGIQGAILAGSFEAIMTAINRAVATSPTIRSKVDVAEREAATKLFAAEFPMVAQIRNASAHPGELSKDAQQLATHRSKGPIQGSGIIVDESQGNNFLSGGMEAGKDKLIYSATFKGKLASYELSGEKADVLAQVAAHYSRAFYPLESAITAQHRAQRQQTEEPLRQDQNAHLPRTGDREQQ